MARFSLRLLILAYFTLAPPVAQHYPLAHETDRTTGKLASSGDTVPLAASGGATSIPPTPTIDPGMFDSLGIPVSVSPGTVGGLEEQLKQLVLEKPYMEGEQRWGSCAGAGKRLLHRYKLCMVVGACLTSSDVAQLQW